MEKKSVFKGAATALITPFSKDGSVDYKSFGVLIDYQIEKKIDALVICGTTGEGSTLSTEEHQDVLKYAVEKVKGRVPVIAGTGSNDIAYAVDLTKFACDIGCDAVLVVTPYYNKATQKGLVISFKTIADNSTKPVILYNVPSRTGVNIEPETYLSLADHPMIYGIKEANSNISKITEAFALVGDKLDIYSGNDDQIVPILSLGGKGVISVLSNCCPELTHKMCYDFFEGRVKESAALQLELNEFVKSLFCEVNPIPVKAAMAHMGFCENVLRLPLTRMEDKHFEEMKSIMKRLKIER